MKIKMILLVLLLFNILSAQTVINDKNHLNKMMISKQINDFKKALKQKNLAIFKSKYGYKNLDIAPEDHVINDMILNIKEIFIDENIASVKFNCWIYDDKKIIENSTNTLFLQKRKNWEITNINLLNEFISKLCSEGNAKTVNSNIIQNKNNESTIPITEVNITISDRTFIPHEMTTGIHDIGFNLTNQHLGEQLFDVASHIDQTLMIHQVNGSGVVDETAFTIDRFWKRIIYGRKRNGQYEDIFSYGDNLLDVIKFKSLEAIDANEFKEVFVLDGIAKSIYKFQYNINNSKLEPVSTASLIDPANLSEPTDIVYNNKTTINVPSDDYLLVADIGIPAILKFDPNGNFIEKYEKFKFGGYDYDMISPLRVTAVGSFLMCIDASQKLVVSGGTFPPSGGDPGFIFTSFGEPSKLPSFASPMDIGFNASNNIIVPDNWLNMIHVFDFYGTYICSYDGIGTPVSFENPLRTTNIVFNQLYVPLIDFSTSDSWSANHGFKRFLPGADAVQFKTTEHEGYIKFHCVMTDACEYYVQLFDSEDELLFDEDGGAFWGGEVYEALIDKSELSSGTYNWVVSTKPASDHLYGSYAVGYQDREFSFDYLQTLPSNITTSKTISGLVYCDGLIVSNNATLTISPGTIIYMNPDANITVENGSKIIAIGDDDYPITFMRASSEERWGNLNLYGDGNQFKYCIFDGGYYGASIRSSDNFFTNCKFKYNSRGISTYSHVQGGWSDFKITECLFRKNSYGVVANYTYGSIDNCTFKDNYKDGLYLYNARIGNDIGNIFHNNYIYSNNRYGINLQHNGKLWLGYTWREGNNRISGNGSHEIYLTSSTSSRLYSSNTGGNSYIYGGLTSYYIYNLAQTFDGEFYTSWTVPAEYNYWGNPEGPQYPQDNFYGQVDYNPFLDSDPTDDPGAHYYKEQITKKIQALSISKNNESFTNTEGDFISLNQRINNLKTLILNNPFNIFNGSYLNNLYSLLDHDPKNLLGHQQSIIEIIDENISRLLNLRGQLPITNPDTLKAIKLIGQTAIVLKINYLYNKSNYDDMLNEVERFISFIDNSDLKRELLMHKLAALENKNRFREALLVLGELCKQVQAGFSYYTAPTFDIIEENLLIQLGLNPEESLNAGNITMLQIESENLPKEFALHQNYPNPFNPITTIPLDLPEKSHVKIEIFNILGQRVAIIITGDIEAGKYKYQYNASRLASGMYILRVTVQSKVNKDNNFDFKQKILLLK